MSEADFAESFWSAQEMGVAALMLYVTVMSGYLVVASLAGRHLSAAQVRLVSTMFVVLALCFMWDVRSFGDPGEGD
jgi:predicted anti-sigma-YlaC factor YlaD